MSQRSRTYAGVSFLPLFGLLCAGLLAGSACKPFRDEPARPPQAAEAAQAELPKVEVFVTDWCPYCQRLEAFLRENKVPYVRHNVEEDEEAARQHDRMTGGSGGIPVTRIGTHVIQGFRPDVIGRYLGIQASD